MTENQWWTWCCAHPKMAQVVKRGVVLLCVAIDRSLSHLPANLLDVSDTAVAAAIIHKHNRARLGSVGRP